MLSKFSFFCLVAMSIIAAPAAESNDFVAWLKKFEVLHLKVIRAQALNGYQVEYMGSTRFASNDRAGEFINASGTGCWVVKVSSVEGVDPAKEIARIYLTEKNAVGAFFVAVEGDGFYLKIFDKVGVCVDREVGQIGVSSKEIFDSISRVKVSTL